ncbi:MAG: RNA methyltransferase [Thermodesulfobacteriota bacterium]
MTRSKTSSLLDNVAIVLMEPKYPENIGAAARTMWNMGLSRLVVVRQEYPEHDRMAKMATHHAVHLIDKMAFHDNLEEALAPFSQVVATTARSGRQRIQEKTPRTVVDEIYPLLENNEVAFLFGPESSGLTNDHLKYCQYASAIPTDDFSSLNLAQAVAIHCYEIYHGVIVDRRTEVPTTKFASTFELEGMYDHLENALLQINFLQDKTHDYYMRNIRQFLGRIRLSAKETKIIRGICRQFLHHRSSTDPGDS